MYVSACNITSTFSPLIATGRDQNVQLNLVRKTAKRKDSRLTFSTGLIPCLLNVTRAIFNMPFRRIYYISLGFEFMKLMKLLWSKFSASSPFNSVPLYNVGLQPRITFMSTNLWLNFLDYAYNHLDCRIWLSVTHLSLDSL